MKDEFRPEIIVPANTSSRDNVVLIGILFTFIVLVSNIITYQVVTANTTRTIMAAEKRLKAESRSMMENQLAVSRSELVRNWEYTIAQVDILESKYYNLETLLANAERRGSVLTVVK